MYKHRKLLLDQKYVMHNEKYVNKSMYLMGEVSSMDSYKNNKELSIFLKNETSQSTSKENYKNLPIKSYDGSCSEKMYSKDTILVEKVFDRQKDMLEFSIQAYFRQINEKRYLSNLLNNVNGKRFKKSDDFIENRILHGKECMVSSFRTGLQSSMNEIHFAENRGNGNNLWDPYYKLSNISCNESIKDVDNLKLEKIVDGSELKESKNFIHPSDSKQSDIQTHTSNYIENNIVDSECKIIQETSREYDIRKLDLICPLPNNTTLENFSFCTNNTFIIKIIKKEQSRLKEYIENLHTDLHNYHSCINQLFSIKNSKSIRTDHEEVLSSTLDHVFIIGNEILNKVQSLNFGDRCLELKTILNKVQTEYINIKTERDVLLQESKLSQEKLQDYEENSKIYNEQLYYLSKINTSLNNRNSELTNFFKTFQNEVRMLSKSLNYISHELVELKHFFNDLKDTKNQIIHEKTLKIQKAQEGFFNFSLCLQNLITDTIPILKIL